MFGLEFLDVIIGMVFVYGMLGLTCTAANEIIINWRGSFRGKILKQGIENLLGKKSKLYEEFSKNPLIKALHLPGDNPSYIPKRAFALSVLQPFIDTVTNGKVTLKEESQTKAYPAEIRTILDQFRATANDDFEQLITETETWFSNATDRMAGWYKRKLQRRSLYMAMLLTVGFNANSIDIARSLYENPQIRSQLAAHAEKYASNPEHNDDGAVAEADERFKSNLENLKKTGLPLGWAGVMWPKKTLPWIGFIANCLFGWLITALAVSLGAPFWFDILSKFMNVRSSGKALNNTLKKENEKATVRSDSTPVQNTTLTP